MLYGYASARCSGLGRVFRLVAAFPPRGACVLGSSHRHGPGCAIAFDKLLTEKRSTRLRTRSHFPSPFSLSLLRLSLPTLSPLFIRSLSLLLYLVSCSCCERMVVQRHAHLTILYHFPIGDEFFGTTGREPQEYCQIGVGARCWLGWRRTEGKKTILTSTKIEMPPACEYFSN